MKNTQNIASLIAKLEYEVGRECYNPNSYDGYTGIEGLGYRYPVKYIKMKIWELIVALLLQFLHQKFILWSMYSDLIIYSSAKVYIIYLMNSKKRYGLDFDKMEEELINQKNRRLHYVNK